MYYEKEIRNFQCNTETSCNIYHVCVDYFQFRFDVSGYPTLKWFRDGQAFDYDGPREEDGIVEYMTSRADPNWKPPPEAVITLTQKNFREIIDNEELMLVEFYAPW